MSNPGGHVQTLSVSVVIPCLNEAAHLESLLDAIRSQDASIHEVIVVDNGSTDGSQAIVEGYQRRHPGWPLRLLSCPAAGAAAAMNVGIQAASGEVIVRLDGHCLPHPDYVRRAVAGLQEDGVGVLGGVWEIAPGGETVVARAIATVLSHRLGTGGAAYRHASGSPEPRDVDTVPFGCYRRTLWERLQGYDEQHEVNEDYVFNYKARLAGARVVLDQAMRCTYFARASLVQLMRQYVRYGWRKADMLKTYPRALQLRQVVPAAFVAAVGGLAVLSVFAVTAQVILLALLLAYASVLAVAAVQLGWSQKAWYAIPAYATAFAVVHIAWGAGACANVVTFSRWPAWKTPQALVPTSDRS